MNSSHPLWGVRCSSTCTSSSLVLLNSLQSICHDGRRTIFLRGRKYHRRHGTEIVDRLAGCARPNNQQEQEWRSMGGKATAILSNESIYTTPKLVQLHYIHLQCASHVCHMCVTCASIPMYVRVCLYASTVGHMPIEVSHVQCCTPSGFAGTHGIQMWLISKTMNVK